MGGCAGLGGDLLNCSVPAVSRLQKFSIMPCSKPPRDSHLQYTLSTLSSLVNGGNFQRMVGHLRPPQSVSGMNPRSWGRSFQSRHFERIGLEDDHWSAWGLRAGRGTQGTNLLSNFFQHLLLSRRMGMPVVSVWPMGISQEKRLLPAPKTTIWYSRLDRAQTNN